MKKIITLLFLFICIYTTNVFADDTYSIKRIHVDMKVEETGKIMIVQNLQGDFSNTTSIRMKLPNKYTYDYEIMGQNITKEYNWDIMSIVVDNNYPYKKSSVDSSQYIVIGDEENPISNEKSLTIRYVVQVADTGDGNEQGISYLFTPALKSEVQAISFSIEMPKIFDIDSLKFYYDGIELENDVGNFAYTIDNTTINGYLNGTVEPYHEFQMKMALGTTYFTFVRSSIMKNSIIIGCLLLSAFALIGFVLFGKDGLIRKVRTHLPPEGLNAASITYIMDGHISFKDISNVIIEWANYGYLRIEEVPDAENIFFVKLKDMGKERWKYERKLFNALFYQRDEILASELDRYFYPYVTNAIREIEKIYSENKENRIFTKSSIAFQCIYHIVTAIPIFVGSYFCLYGYFYHVELSLLGSIGFTLICILVELLWYHVVSNKNTWHKYKYYFGIIVCCIAFVVFADAYNYLFVSTTNAEYVYYATLTCFGVLLLVTLFMDKRTPVGKAWYGEILGLKDFIIHSTEDEIKEILKEQPNYVYLILPYAYIMGVSDVWIKKCIPLNIQAPSWYIGEQTTLKTFAAKYYRILIIMKHHMSIYSLAHTPKKQKTH